MLTKTQLKDLFSKYDFKPLKRYGENYLIDSNIKDKIIGEIGISSGDVILEIGPGLGALTIDIAETGVEVTAVEKDKKAFAILRDLVDGDFVNLRLVNADILEFDISGFAAGRKIKIVGNLPYYITSPIIEKIVSEHDIVRSATILVQKEFAERLVAKPGTKEYGSFSCFVQYHAKISYIYTVKHASFYPEPDINSGILKLDMLDRPLVEVRDEDLLFRIIRGAFNQRRKSIINSLSREVVLDLAKEALVRVLKRACVDPAARPETLSLSDFARIANSISS